MVRITEELIRKRAEHNEGEIFSLEELSLHQQNLERIEHIDMWCRDLRILYLQSNLIGKIENVGRLKKLEYLNMALNNIERIENLEGCEFLKKLDLTVNFVGELTSVANLAENYHLRELYLTGNPCTDFPGYRDYVVCTLPQLQVLDGTAIKTSDRIRALQNFKQISKTVEEKQFEFFKQREHQRAEFEEKRVKLENGEINENFWNEKSEYTPESRLEMHLQQEQQKKREEDEKTKSDAANPLKVKKERKYFAEDGKPYSFNDPKVDYDYADTDEAITLTVHVFKHLDSSLVDVDVQPWYVRVMLKGKALQLALNEEVRPGASSAKRSQITGQLIVRMPKVKQVVRPEIPLTVSLEQQKKKDDELKRKKATGGEGGESEVLKKESVYLEVDDGAAARLKKTDLANIVSESESKRAAALNKRNAVVERANSADFVDDADVPPLE